VDEGVNLLAFLSGKLRKKRVVLRCFAAEEGAFGFDVECRKLSGTPIGRTIEMKGGDDHAPRVNPGE
jgi:hypothetical protein